MAPRKKKSNPGGGGQGELTVTDQPPMSTFDSELDGQSVPKTEESDGSGCADQHETIGSSLLQRSALAGCEWQHQQDFSQLVAVDVSQALLAHLMALADTGVTVITGHKELSLLVKSFLDEHQVTISSFPPDNMPPKEWMHHFLGQYSRRLLAVQKSAKKEIKKLKQRMPIASTKEQAAVVNEQTKSDSNGPDLLLPADSNVKTVVPAPSTDKAAAEQFTFDKDLLKKSFVVGQMTLNVVEEVDEREELAFVTGLIRSGKQHSIDQLPSLLKQYLDERKITVGWFAHNWPSSEYMNGFLHRHGKYLKAIQEAINQEPAPPNPVTTTINQDKMMVSSGHQKKRNFEGQLPLVKDGKLTLEKEEMLQVRYDARLQAAFDSHLAGDFPSTLDTAKQFLVREGDLVDRIGYESRLDKALSAILTGNWTIEDAAQRFSLLPEALLTRVHEHNMENVTKDRQFAITPKMETAFVKTLVAAGIVRQRRELPALLMAFFDRQGFEVPNNLSLGNWSKSFVRVPKHWDRLKELIAD